MADAASSLTYSFTDRCAMAIATVAGAGFSPLAPGTAGALVSVAVWLIFMRWIPVALHLPIHLAWLTVVTLVGIWASTRAEIRIGVHDPRQVVVDEFVGQQIAYLGLSPLGWRSLLLGFALFRLFDVWKPSPIRQSQELPGGWGIVIDDVLAGIYALVVLIVVRKMFPWV
ncbi:MAG: phosphatidylglycerophosphatase A [Acidobacteriia bacterium]|nr:phosphatidylglycerophosphatase A [Terriglobia bacterium]